jgi:hypothetical protein
MPAMKSNCNFRQSKQNLWQAEETTNQPVKQLFAIRIRSVFHPWLLFLSRSTIFADHREMDGLE